MVIVIIHVTPALKYLPYTGFQNLEDNCMYAMEDFGEGTTYVSYQIKETIKCF